MFIKDSDSIADDLYRVCSKNKIGSCGVFINGK